LYLRGGGLGANSDRRFVRIIWEEIVEKEPLVLGSAIYRDINGGVNRERKEFSLRSLAFLC